jgi:hypothetical protein
MSEVTSGKKQKPRVITPELAAAKPVSTTRLAKQINRQPAKSRCQASDGHVYGSVN